MFLSIIFASTVTSLAGSQMYILLIMVLSIVDYRLHRGGEYREEEYCCTIS
jgi:hypothetical protein